MNQYQFISENLDIVQYVEEMAEWIENNSDCSPEKITMLIFEDQTRIKGIFEPYPETIFHDSPAKWAELLAISWGIIQERELEFV